MKTPMTVLAVSLAAILFIVGLLAHIHPLMQFTKPLPALLMGLWVLRSGDRHIAFGLAAGAAGDVLIDLPVGLLPAMVAFGAGHLFYLTAFWRWQPKFSPQGLVPIVIYLGVVFALITTASGALTIPVGIYLLIIGAMIWRAMVCAQEADSSAPTRWLPLAGALTFAFSDTLIAVNRFVVPLHGAEFAIIAFYWVGQALIATSGVVHSENSIRTY